jgi:hypothetical protein
MVSPVFIFSIGKNRDFSPIFRQESANNGRFSAGKKVCESPSLLSVPHKLAYLDMRSTRQTLAGRVD